VFASKFVYQFLSHLLPYLKASLPITDCIRLTGESEKRFKKISDNILPLIQRGHSLSLALESSGAPKDCIAWIQLGEQTGDLTLGISCALNIFESQKDTTKKFIGILRYPMIVFGFMIVGVFILNSTTLPAIKNFYGSQNLPEITQLIFDHPQWISGFLLLIPCIFFYFLKPFKTLQSKINLCLSLSLKLHSGMTLGDAAPLAWRAFLNQGYPLSIILDVKKQDRFLIQLAKIGETTGTLPESFTQAQKFYQHRFDLYLERLQAYLPSVLMLIVGCFVGILVIAIYLPMLQINLN
jgi:type II secretory pathway component PulF